MQSNWINIFSSDQPLEAEIIKQMLKENDIIAVIINKQDSSYNMFGQANLYVKSLDKPKALKIMNAKHNERDS